MSSAERRALVVAAGFAIVSFTASSARAHEDPAGCFETGVAIVVSVFRANGTTGVVGSVSECEPINYRARLQKSSSSDTLCAFSGGIFRLTTPDGVVHDISLDVPCIGGTAGEGCDATVTQLQSALIPYTVQTSDIVGGLVTATARYTGGVTHDGPGNTAGVSALTPRSTSVVRCVDNDLCTTDVCDPALRGAAACSFPPVVCQDNDACTADLCDPATGACTFPQNVVCTDNDLCTADACDPATGQCAFTPNVVCIDNNLCTADACDPATGQCTFTPNVVCTDNDLCTADACNPATGQCTFTPNVTCTDNDLCTTDACNPATGQCTFTPNVVCTDNDLCTRDACNPATGQCTFTPNVTCTDNDLCTTDACNPATGQCTFTPRAPCTDNDICTDDVCDPTTGECVFVADPGNDPSCAGDCLCLLVCDEDFIDNGMQSVERAADDCGVNPDVLVNDDHPTEVGNPPLHWNTHCAPDMTVLPTGQVDEEGCFMLPLGGATIDYADSSFNATCPRNTAEWADLYVRGLIPQRCLDKVKNVMPIRNQDWAKLVGKSCVVVQYDSDISENYKPIYANLQGARYGLFYMTIDGIVLPGTLPESGSSTDLYDLAITADPVPPEADVCLDTFGIVVRDHEPDSCQLTRARCSGGTLEVRATNDFRNRTVNGSPTLMTVSIDGLVLEAPMTWAASRWNYVAPCPGNNLTGRRISVQTNAGCAYNGTITTQ